MKCSIETLKQNPRKYFIFTINIYRFIEFIVSRTHFVGKFNTNIISSPSSRWEDNVGNLNRFLTMKRTLVLVPIVNR